MIIKEMMMARYNKYFTVIKAITVVVHINVNDEYEM